MPRCLLITSSNTSDIDDCTNIVDNFLESLIEAGATVHEITDEDYEDSTSFGAIAIIEFPPDFRERYFENAYRALKRKVDSLSLTTFATDNAETMSLSQIINDETELVCFDSTYYTVDEFIRGVMPDTQYFVAKDNALIIG